MFAGVLPDDAQAVLKQSAANAFSCMLRIDKQSHNCFRSHMRPSDYLTVFLVYIHYISREPTSSVISSRQTLFAAIIPVLLITYVWGIPYTL